MPQVWDPRRRDSHRQLCKIYLGVCYTLQNMLLHRCYIVRLLHMLLHFCYIVQNILLHCCSIVQNIRWGRWAALFHFTLCSLLLCQLTLKVKKCKVCDGDWRQILVRGKLAVDLGRKVTKGFWHFKCFFIGSDWPRKKVTLTVDLERWPRILTFHFIFIDLHSGWIDQGKRWL